MTHISDAIAENCAGFLLSSCNCIPLKLVELTRIILITLFVLFASWSHDKEKKCAYLEIKIYIAESLTMVLIEICIVLVPSVLTFLSLVGGLTNCLLTKAMMATMFISKFKVNINLLIFSIEYVAPGILFLSSNRAQNKQ